MLQWTQIFRGYEMPACSLIEDPENGEKEWLQMVAELESRKN